MSNFSRQAPYSQDLSHSMALVGMHIQNDTQTKNASVPKKSKPKASSKSDDNASLFSTSTFSSTKQLLKNKFSPSSSSSPERKSKKSERKPTIAQPEFGSVQRRWAMPVAR